MKLLGLDWKRSLGVSGWDIRYKARYKDMTILLQTGSKHRNPSIFASVVPKKGRARFIAGVVWKDGEASEIIGVEDYTLIPFLKSVLETALLVGVE